jgi:hypothetical protein
MFQAFKDAMERAGTEVLSWIPEKIGDRIAGKVIDLGSVTTPYGTSPTTTHEVYGPDYKENGAAESATGANGKPKLVRVAWMGAVLEAQYFRMLPQPDDFCAFEYQSDVTPKTEGYNEYKLINAVVLDGNTLKAKVPANFRVQVPTRQQLENADPRTGALPEVGTSPLTPRPDEAPLEATAEEMAAAEKTGGRFRRNAPASE